MTSDEVPGRCLILDEDEVPTMSHDQRMSHQRSKYEASRLLHIDNWVQKTCENQKTRGGSSNRSNVYNLYCETNAVGDASSIKQSVDAQPDRNTQTTNASRIPGATSAFPSNSFDKRPSLPSGFKDVVAVSTNSSATSGANNSGSGQSKSPFRPLEDVLPKL